MYRWLARNILGPVQDFSSGTKTMDCLHDLEISQWWTQDKILDLQNERLQKLIKHACENVPYYQRLFNERNLKPDELKSRQDLAKLPILNKKIIRNNFNLLMARNFPRERMIPTSTSGSTGEPLAFYGTVEDQQNWGLARVLRAQSWAGYKKGDRLLGFNTHLKNKTSLEKLRNGLKRSLERIIILDPKNISSDSLPNIIKSILKFQPDFLWGYPSAIYLIAQHLHRTGITNCKLKAVMTGGEQLFDYQRDLFNNVFKCTTYSYYSSWEVHCITGECEQHTGQHINAENLIIEIVDANSNPVPAGEEGRILITNLHNYAMPFIRYDIGDMGAISEIGCPCGRTGLPLLIKLNGRADSFLLTRSGKQIPGRSISHRFLANLGVAQYQTIQENYEEIVIKIVLDKEYSEEYKLYVIREVKAFYQPIIGDEISIKVQFEKNIPSAKTGKREIFISRITG